MTNYNPNQNKKQTTDLSSFVFGKVTPSAPKVEETVIGAMLLDSEAYFLVANILRRDSFWDIKCQLIFDSICELAKAKISIDLLTVTEGCRRLGTLDDIGGAYHLVELTNHVGSAANIEYHARILIQYEMKREKIRLSAHTLNMCYDETTDVFEVLNNDHVESSRINSIPERIREKKTLKSISERAIAEFKEIQAGTAKGISTGYRSVDTITNGWRKSKFIVIGARPSMGKSGHCINTAYNAAIQGFQVNLFSLEMTDVEVINILASIHCGIEIAKFNGLETPSESETIKWIQAHEFISSLPISIEDLAKQSSSSMLSFARQKYRENGLEQINLIDYLQLVDNDDDVKKNQNREQDVSRISRSCVIMAKELNCPVIAYAQLSRAVETRGGDRVPQLSDLRESGSLEQDANIVGFLYRAEYYNIAEDEYGQSTTDVLDFVIRKNRGGRIGKAKLHYNRFVQKITDWDFMEEERIRKNSRVIATLPDGTTEDVTANFDTIPRSAATNPDDDDFLPF